MEDRIGSSHVAEILEKPSSLDIKNLYKSRTSKTGEKKSLKRKSVVNNGSGNVQDNKKARKEVSLSSLKNVRSNGSSSLDESQNGSKPSKLQESKNSKSGLSKKLKNRTEVSSISLNLVDSIARIPKKKRGYVGRSRFESSALPLKPYIESSEQLGFSYPTNNVTCAGLGNSLESSKVHKIQSLDDHKESRNIESKEDRNSDPCTVQEAKEEDRQPGHSFHKNKKGDLSLKKSRKKHTNKEVNKNSKSKEDSNTDPNAAQQLKEEDRQPGHSLLKNGDLSLKKLSKNHRKKEATRNNKPKEDRNSDPSTAQQLKEEDEHSCHSFLKNGDLSLKKSRKNLKEREENGNSGSKEDRHSDPCTARQLKEEEGRPSHSLLNNGDLSLKKPRKNRRKTEDSGVKIKSAAKKAEPVVGACANELQDEDEENLEENAARMLSSRFDPSCTGFSSNRRASVSPASKESSFLVSSRQDFVQHGTKYLAGSKSALVDAPVRILRPRKQDKEKFHSRKRRHYYEISSQELDAHWALNRRIKVFWPLDQSWYYGLVNEYDEQTRLHHIKYDDRDEEWIKLQNERFKLLLLHSEVPTKDWKRSDEQGDHSDDGILQLKSNSEKVEGGAAMKDNDYGNGLADSEPIISWLARSNHRIKSLPFHPLKKQKTSSLSSTSVQPYLPDEAADASMDEASLNRQNGLSSDSLTSDRKLSVVYSRRRLPKTGNLLCHDYATSNITGLLEAAPSAAHESIADEEDDMPFWSLESDEASWLPGNLIPFKLTIQSAESTQFRFLFDISFLKTIFWAEDVWVLRAILMLQYGTVMNRWPRVSLEIFFVDNVVGLRFLLFEGCLVQAVAFVIMVLSMFHESDHRKYDELHLPVTSVRFRFSSLQGPRKHHPFTFYNFCEVKSSKWMFLDRELKKHCLLTSQLPLLECTYDNIKSLQCENQLSLSAKDFASAEESNRRLRHAMTLIDVSPELDSVNPSHCSDMAKKHTSFPPFALCFTAAPAFFLNLHLKLLMERSVAHINFQDDDSVDGLANSGCLMDIDCRAMEYSSNKGSGSSLENDTDAIQLKKLQKNILVMENCDLSPRPIDKDHVVDNGIHSSLKSMTVEIPPFDRFEKHVEKESSCVQQPKGLFCLINGGIIPSPNPTARRSNWHRNRKISSVKYLTHGWMDGKSDLFRGNFVDGPKKQRTQVSYALPSGNSEYGSNNKNVHHKGVPHKRIRKATEKTPQKNLELLSCDANVLITTGDQGWRECGAHVVLELCDQGDWKLAVKLSENTKYSYKPYQFLQPGFTNRYTLAMMWKGGKDWILEFPDRSQWSLFKEMHEECYNRNIRVSSIKNIPIPGVRVTEEHDVNRIDMTFFRSSKYYQQVETDIEMALNRSRALYDMDSEDEMWMLEFRDTSWEISEEIFEKIMDMFEKAAYVEQRDQFTLEEVEGLMAGVGSMEATKSIYEHWRLKRQSKGLPLIRHLQPPLWETYQHQIKEWELATRKVNSILPNGCPDKVVSAEKPPMHAFCLKPRGLEVPNKGSKQKPPQKISLSGLTNTVLGEDTVHAYGRRLNGFSSGDDDYESLEDSPSPQMDYLRKLQKKKSKKFVKYVSTNDTLNMASHRPRVTAKSDESQHWNMELDGSEVDEFKLRDASSAAQHARNMAKLKRERARRMHYRADVAIHKAVVALTTAEAIKASYENLNDSGSD